MTLKLRIYDLHFQYQLWVSILSILSANFVIPAQICDELSCEQSKVYGRTGGRTDAGNDNTPSAWNVMGKNLARQV